MPKTATVVASFSPGVLPLALSGEQLNQAIQALEHDLPGDPIAYIKHVAPRSEQCECGAIHLAVNDSELSEICAHSLHRVLATPYGDIVREYFRRHGGYKTIRFGWEGIEQTVPQFMMAVDQYGVRSTRASQISDQIFHEIIESFRYDMPEVMNMIESSAQLTSETDDSDRLRSYAVSAAADDAGRVQWQRLITQLMFAWSTPVRKYLDEYLLRDYAMVGGAVNCCIVSTMRAGNTSWRQQWFDEQTCQQLTPDC